MLFQTGTLFYLLASANGLALRQPRVIPSSRINNALPLPSGTRVNVALAAATPSGGVTKNSDGLWTSVQCGENHIDDATIDFAERWNAADVPGAWNAMLEKWNSEAQNNKFRGLSFSQFASYYFSGPEQWNCQDVGSVPCSTVVQCKDVEHPAGYGLTHSASLGTVRCANIGLATFFWMLSLVSIRCEFLEIPNLTFLASDINLEMFFITATQWNARCTPHSDGPNSEQSRRFFLPLRSPERWYQNHPSNLWQFDHPTWILPSRDV